MPPRTAAGPLIGFPLLGLLLRVLGVLVLVLVLLLGFVLGTQTGLRMALAVAEELAPETISVGRVDGRVLGELTLGEVALDLPGLALRLGRLHLAWQPAALFSGKLRIADLSAADIDIVAAPSDKEKPPPEPFRLPELRLPIGVEIDRALVERLSFRQEGASPEAAIRVKRAELSASAVGDRVSLRRLEAELAQPEATATAVGSAGLGGDHPLDLQLDWRFYQPPALALTGAGSITGSVTALGIEHRLDGAVTLTLDARVRDVLEAPSWQGELRLERIDLPAVVADAPAVNLTALLRTEGDLDKATVTGTLSGDAPELADFGKLTAELDIGWAGRRLTLNAVRLDETESGAMLNLTGHVDLATDTPAFEVSGAWERLRWPLTGEALVQAPLGRLDLTGNLDAFDYALSGALFGAQMPEMELGLTGNGSGDSTRIDSLLVETLGGRIEAKGTAAWAPAVTWDLALTAADIDPGLQVPGLDGTVSLKADSSGGLEDGYVFGANLVAQLSAYPAAVVNLAGEGDLTRVQLDALTVETLGGLAEGAGEVVWVPGLAWEVALTANDLDPGRQYPGMDGRVGLRIESAGGLADGFDFKLRGSAAVADYPPAVVDLQGGGTAQAAVLETLAIEVLDGRIDGSGRVAWAPAVSWDAALELAGLDPGSLAADWPGRIGGRVSSTGRLTEQGPELSARISDVAGELRGYPVRLAAELDRAGERLRLRTLTAGSGSTRLQADGAMAGEALDLRFDFASPDLAALVPGGAGSLDASGTVGGTLTAPRLRLRLRGRDAELNGQGIAEISGNIDVGLGADGDFDIDIDGSNLVAGGQRFETLAVRGTGRMDRHSLTATLDGEAVGLALAADGGLGPDGGYAGSLGELTLTTEELGTWGLQRPAAFAYAEGAARAGPLCLGNGQGSGGCVGFEQPQPGRFEASLDVERIDFDILNPLLPELLVMRGHVRAAGRFRGEGTALAGSARVDVPTGEIELALDDESRDRLVFSGTRLDVTADADALGARFSLPLTGLGSVAADVTLPGFRLDAGASQPLRGAVRVELTELSRISKLLPDIDDVAGGIDGDLRLAGTLDAPDLQGELRVRDLGLAVPLYGFALSNGDLTATSRGRSAFAVSGAAQVGGGRLDLDGTLDFGSGAPAAELSVRGDDLVVADSREYFARLSLEMAVGLGAAGTAVRGRIDVPEARIKPRTVPTGAVQPSSDVVMEGSADDKKAVPLSIDVLARLGEEVSIDAFGLRGFLRGRLRVLKSPQGEILGDGQLKIVDGTYRVTLPTLGVLTAIGKPLTIEQGIVTFAKTPIANPGLILNAQREGGDITAGVRVLGTLRDPKLAFFSESDPNLTQSEVTQYLITGIPPKRGAEADSRALSVGTYVAPKLYMEYEGATSDAQESVKMRYDLSNHVELQTETGETQGGDIFFKFEN
jgi:translocation and assembly module TamB